MTELMTQQKYDSMDEADQIKYLQKALIYWVTSYDEETMEILEKLKRQLKEATAEDAEYEKYIEDQKKLSDNLYNEHSTILNQQADNADAIFADDIEAE